MELRSSAAVIALCIAVSACAGRGESNGLAQTRSDLTAKVCANRGPSQVSFNAGTCVSGDPGLLSYLFYGSDGSGGAYSSSTAFNPTPTVTSAIEDVSVACDPMVFSIAAVGPATYASDSPFRWFSLSEADFQQLWLAMTGQMPNPATDYFSYTALQYIVDAWYCRDPSVPGSGTCWSKVPPLTWTYLGNSKAYTASADRCDHSFTIAVRD
jgi:hypothetical protein